MLVVALFAAAAPVPPGYGGWLTPTVAIAIVGLGQAVVGLAVLKLNIDQTNRAKVDEARAKEVQRVLEVNTLAAQTAAADLDKKQTLQVATQGRRDEQVRKTLEASTEANATQIADIRHEQTALASVVGGVVKVTTATHTLVNSNMGIERLHELKEKAEWAQELADATGKPEHVERARLAAEKYAAHQAKQEVVDGQPGTAAEKQGKPEPGASPS